MRKFLLVSLTPILISVIILSFIYTVFANKSPSEFPSPVANTSTIPTPTSTLYANVLGMQTNLESNANGYFPLSFSPEFVETEFDLDVDSYIAFDRDSRKILYGKNIMKRMPIASLTKIVTTLTSLESAPLELEMYVSSQAASVGEATMGLTFGESITMKDGLYGAMLPSGNDASETVAEGVGKYNLGTKQIEIDGGGARQWFLDRMNEKMQNLGLFDTYFFNPSGLDGENLVDTNFSTALDLAIFTHYALLNEQFSEIARTREWFIPYSEGKHKAFYLYNILQFDRSYPGIQGVKPGISNYAKETLASYVEHNGRRIIVILLGSSHTKDDAIAIYNKIFGTDIGLF